MTQKTVGIFIFDQVEVLDFCGPFEVFSMANEVSGENTIPPFRVVLVAALQQTIKTVGGMNIQPHCTFEDCPQLEILLVPGGIGTRQALADPKVIAWVQKQAKKVELTTSVCTGSLVLAAAKLLDGRHATTHWMLLALLKEKFPQVQVEDKLHVVKDENIWTSAGVSAGIDLALHVVAKYCGEKIARETARRMEYPYPETNQRRVAIA